MRISNFIRAGYGLPETRQTSAVEHRSPSTSAIAPVGWYNKDLPSLPDFDASASISKAYQANIYAFRCIDTIANDIANCAFRAGDPVSYNFNLNAPLARLLGPAPGSPNPNWSAHTLWRYSIAQYLVMGKFGWSIERDNRNQIVGLWPLQAQYLNPILNDNPSNPSYFKGFTYGIKGSKGYTEFRQDQVIYIYRPSLADLRKPESPIQPASSNLNIAGLLEQLDYSLLRNGGVPSHLIITPPFVDKDQKQAFREQFYAEFGGVNQAGKPMFIERDVEQGDVGGPSTETVDVKTLAVSAKDAQYDVLRTAQKIDICLAFGVPLSILGDSTLARFQNAPVDRRVYWQNTLHPKIRELQDGVNTTLAPMIGRETGWFDVTGIPELHHEPTLPEGSEAVALESAGAFTWNEWRADRGLPPLEVEPEPILPDESSIVTDSTPAPVTPPASAPAPLRGKRADEGHTIWTLGDSASGPCEICEPLEGTIDSELDPDVDTHPNCVCEKLPYVGEEGELVRSKRHAGSNHKPVPSGHMTKDVMERLLTNQLNILFEEQAKAVKQWITSRAAKAGFDANKAYNKQYWTERSTKLIGPILEETGYTSNKVYSISSDITNKMFSLLGDSDVNTLFESATGMALQIIMSDYNQGYINSNLVEQALMDIYSGTLTANSVIASWGESYA